MSLKILCISPEFYGHFLPLYSVADTLVKFNHEVTFHSTKNFAKNFKNPKIKVKIYEYNENQALFEKKEDSPKDFLVACSFLEGFGQLYQELLKDETQYDILFYDSFYDGQEIAKKLKIPKAICSHSIRTGRLDRIPQRQLININHDAAEEFNKKMNFNFKFMLEAHDKNTSFKGIYYTSKLVFFCKDDLKENNYFIGPDTLTNTEVNKEEFDFVKKPDHKVLYVTLGTVFNEDGNSILMKAIEAFNDYKNLQVVISTGRNYDVEAYKKKAASNIYLYKFVPQGYLLKFTDVFITQGGFNSVNQALYFNNIPMIIVPQGADQFLSALSLSTQGCAIFLPSERVTPEVLKSSYERIINDNNFKTAATKLGDTLREAHDQRESVIKELFS